MPEEQRKYVFTEKLHASIRSVLSASVWHGIISIMRWSSLLYNANIPGNCTGFLGNSWISIFPHLKHGTAKSTLPEVLLAVSGELEFNYSNDSWKMKVSSSPSHWNMCSWDFYTFEAIAERTLKVIHRVPWKQSGFWGLPAWPLLNSLVPCEMSW